MTALLSSALATNVRGNNHWLLHWGPNQRKTVYLCSLVFSLCAIVWAAVLSRIWDQHNAQVPGHPPRFGDFFALWSYAKLAGTHSAAELYDFAALHAGQVALGMDPDLQNPFPYPPTVLLLLWPLGLVPYEAAYLLWIIGMLSLFLWAVRRTCSRLPVCMLGIILASVSAVTIVSGQSGFLAAALITAGVRLAASRPVLSGVLIGILTYKPQLGILVPVALAAARFWQAFFVACITALSLAVVATLVFGWAIWPAWVSMLPAYSAWFDQVLVDLRFIPTITATLQLIGIALPIAKGLQAVVAVAVAVLVWRWFRRDPGPLSAALLLVGTFLVTPHAFIYDMPMLIAAMALFIEVRLKESTTLHVAEIVVLFLAFLSPLLMMVVNLRLPINVMPSMMLFGLILRRGSIPATYRGRLQMHALDRGQL